MGFDIGSIFAGGAEGIFKGISDIIGKFKADPNIAAQSAATIAQAEAALKQAQNDYELKMALAQVEVNKIEAASSNSFTSNWRPAIGWICGAGFAYAAVLSPFLTWISFWIANGKPGPAPVLDTSTLMPVLLGMLGLGTMRSFDKMQGTVRK